MRHLLLAIALLCAATTAIGDGGCAEALHVLPAIITATTHAAEVVDAIESFVAAHDARTEAIDTAIARTRNAIDAVKHAANATSDIHDGALQAALAEAEAAYHALIALVQPLGVQPRPGGGLMAASGPGTLSVPTPPDFRRELEGG
jgi:hypothetical protein